jgi:hypothetical protein
MFRKLDLFPSSGELYTHEEGAPDILRTGGWVGFIAGRDAVE